MKPGDIVMWKDTKFGRNRFWEIIGVYLGAVDQEGLIELQSLTEKPQEGHGTTMVPEPLLRDALVYTPDISRAA